MDLESTEPNVSSSRRTFLRNAGVVGGVAWVGPQIVSATPAFAQTSPNECVTLDSFNDSSDKFEIDFTSPGAKTGTWADASAIGGSRDYRIESSGTGNVVVTISNGVLDIGTTKNAGAMVELAYDGPGVPGAGLNLDLSHAATITLEIALEVVVDPDPVDVTLVLNSLGVTKLVGTGFAGILTWTPAEFPGVDFSDIDSIILRVNSTKQPGTDLVIDQFQACP